MRLADAMVAHKLDTYGRTYRGRKRRPSNLGPNNLDPPGRARIARMENFPNRRAPLLN